MGCVRIRVNSQFWPKVSTSSRDCGVATTEELIRHGSRGKIKLSAGQVRKRMGNQNDWTTPLDVQKAVNSIDAENRRRGMEPLKYKLAGRWNGNLISKGASKRSLLKRAQRGELIGLVIDYAKVNNKYPWLSGSKSFMGLHSVWVGGYTGWGKAGARKRGGQWWLRYADPTWNRSGTPKGVTWVKLSVVWDISDGVWSSKGGSGWVGGSVKCANLLTPDEPKPPPDPEDPVDPCDEKLVDLEEQLIDAQGALDDARDIIEQLKSKRLPRELVDRLLELADEIDAQVPVIEGVADTDIVKGTEVVEA